MSAEPSRLTCSVGGSGFQEGEETFKGYLFSDSQEEMAIRSSERAIGARRVVCVRGGREEEIGFGKRRQDSVGSSQEGPLTEPWDQASEGGAGTPWSPCRAPGRSQGWAAAPAPRVRSRSRKLGLSPGHGANRTHRPRSVMTRLPPPSESVPLGI